MLFRTRKQGFVATLVLPLALIAIAIPAAPALAGGGANGFAAPDPDRSTDARGGGNDRADDNGGGGKNDSSDDGGASGFADVEAGGKGGKAKLKGGDAVPPAGAPKEVVKAIKAANEINEMPYQYGGGHGEKKAKGYDCSGAISYALRGAKMLKDPLDSGGFTKWGSKGEGKWITVYANGGHAYVVIAGLRFDTSSAGAASGRQDGPRWWDEKAPTKGYKVRHPAGF